MTHDELLIEINRRLNVALYNGDPQIAHALRAVVELHKPDPENTLYCEAENEWVSWNQYPCETIQAIEKELS